MSAANGDAERFTTTSAPERPSPPQKTASPIETPIVLPPRQKTCGVPGQVGRLHRWMTNGTIVDARMTGIRQVFMAADFLPELRERISEGLDFPVSPIFYEAERNSVRVTVEAFLRGPLLRLTARIPIFRRAAVHYFNNLAWATGTASSHTVAYHSGRYGLALMRNPFDLDLMAAVVVGAVMVVRPSVTVNVIVAPTSPVPLAEALETLDALIGTVAAAMVTTGSTTSLVEVCVSCTWSPARFVATTL